MSSTFCSFENAYYFSRIALAVFIPLFVGCSGSEKPPMAPAAQRPIAQQRIASTEFKRRFEKLDQPVPYSQLLFSFGKPKIELELAAYDLPMICSYQCLDRQINVVFGVVGNTYGAVRLIEGFLSEHEIGVLNDALIAEARAYTALNLKREAEHVVRTMRELLDECRNGRARILEHRAEQRQKLIESIERQNESQQQNYEKEWAVLKERIELVAPAARFAALQLECQRRNVRLKTHFQDLYGQLNATLNWHTERQERFVKILADSMKKRTQDYQPLRSRLQLLAKELHDYEELHALLNEPLADVPSAAEQDVEKIADLNRAWQSAEPLAMDPVKIAQELNIDLPNTANATTTMNTSKP